MRPDAELKLSVKISQIAEFACIMFFANSFFRTGINWMLGGNSSIATLLALVCTYFPVLIICVLAPSRYLKLDFVILYVLIAGFLALTLIFHPEYEYYYAREDYGVWDHVLIPYRGIYAYLFIRLVDNPKRILACMKKAGWLMFIYFGYQLILFLRRGYWVGVAGTNASAHLSYSVSFGYDMLPFALVFLYFALTSKKWNDIFASIMSVVMILMGGSRGPVLFLGLFFVVYLLRTLQRSKKKILIIFGTIILSVGLYLVYEPALIGISTLISKLGFSSRFITTLLSGRITNDSGRSRIWMAAINMIKDNPFGYGAMGSRSTISQYIVAGYPHSVVLEILIDYGVFFGGMLLTVFLVGSFKLLFMQKESEWSGVFLIFWAASCSLLISLTYWSIPSFWAAIGVGVCYYKSTKLRSRKKPRKEKTDV